MLENEGRVGKKMHGVRVVGKRVEERSSREGRVVMVQNVEKYERREK